MVVYWNFIKISSGICYIKKKICQKIFIQNGKYFAILGGLFTKFPSKISPSKSFFSSFFFGGGVVGVCRLRKGIFGEDKIGSPWNGGGSIWCLNGAKFAPPPLQPFGCFWHLPYKIFVIFLLGIVFILKSGEIRKTNTDWVVPSSAHC